MSTFSTDLKIELIGTGEQSGVWGTTTNNNFQNVFEQALVGRVTVPFTDANVTLSATDTVNSQSFRRLYLNCTGANTASRDLIVPTINKTYVVQNNTTGNQNIVIKTSLGTGVTVPNGRTATVYVDGTNVIQAFDYLPVIAVGAGTVSTPSITFTTDSNTGIYSPAADTIAFAEGGAEAMRIDSSGNVGIGTTSPSKKLDIVTNTSQDGIRITGSSNPRITIIDSTNSVQFDALATDTEVVLRTDTNHPLALSTNGTERMRIDSSGNVGIGTTSFAAKLQVATAAASPTGVAAGVRIYDTTNNYGLNLGSTNAIGWIQGLRGVTSTDGYNDLSLNPNGGNVGIGTSSPSTRLHVVSTGGAIRMQDNASIAKYIQMRSDATNSYLEHIGGTGDALRINNQTPGTLEFYTSNTERMRIDSSGNVLVGTSSSLGSGQIQLVRNANDGLTRFTISNNSAGSSAVSYLLIGNDTASAGYAGLRGSSSTNTSFGGANAVEFFNNLANLSFSTSGVQRMNIDVSGNVGIGCTPSTFSGLSTGRLEVGAIGNSLFSNGSTNFWVTSNTNYETGPGYKYATSAAATYYLQSAGTHQWATAVSGTAGNVITFTERMRIDSSGRLLVGTTSTLGGTSAGAIVNAVSSGNNLSLEKSTGGAIGFYQSGVITSLIEDVSSQGGLRFYTGTSGTVTEKVRIPAAGGLQVVNCVSVGNATPSASGAGITFPATQSASSDANTLDDYEEGTWTPTITRASTGPTLTVSNSGRYVKIGRQVTLWGKITITAVTAQGTNVWIITSLPFVMSGQRGAMGASGNFSTTSISTTTNITAVGDAIVDNYLYCQNSDGSTTDANFQAGSLYFTITYET